jgi:FemAB-related protein (PEP-CTERM system-associated)
MRLHGGLTSRNRSNDVDGPEFAVRPVQPIGTLVIELSENREVGRKKNENSIMLQAHASLALHVHDQRTLPAEMPRLEAFFRQQATLRPLSLHPGWLNVLARAFSHSPYCLEVRESGQTRGILPLAYVNTWLFGRYLVGLPYLNSGGVMADNDGTAALLVEEAVNLANTLNVRHLELRHERPLEHAALTHARTDKVHMRLDLPTDVDKLWKQVSAKVRNQIRKGQKAGLTVEWGGQDLLSDFYAVFSRNMRDLGTPVYSKKLFANILAEFSARAEICLVRAGKSAVAGAILLHGWGVSEVPSASCLREYNDVCANMLMYWHLLERAVQRKQEMFDFGRSSEDSNTFRFKKQWGAKPMPAEWQFHVRSREFQAMRPDNPKYQRFVRWWKRLPVSLTRLIGPAIVRGIP